MRRLLFSVVLLGIFIGGALVHAVTNGQPDGNRHPYVGVAIQPIPTMPGFVYVCSGAALSAKVFLTAAHCFDSHQPAFVSYKSGPPFSLATDFTPGTFEVEPDWCPGCGPGLAGFDFHDVAVITLDTANDPGSHAALPTANLVDSLPMGARIDIVGYGVQGFVNGGGPRGQIFLFTRYFAPSQFVNSNDVQSREFVKLTANPAKGKGGLCFGDSGGPDLLGGSNTVVSVNSYVTNGNCSGVTYSNRVDLPDILAWIQGILSKAV